MREKFNPEDYPAIPVFSWLGCFSPLIVIPAVVPALALYSAPANVLDQVPRLRAFTNWFTDTIPYMSAHADATQIQQVALLVNCLALAAAAVIALVFACQSTLNYRYLYHRHVATGPHPFRTYWVCFLGPPIAIGMLAAMVMIPGDVSWAPGATQSRTFFYGFLSVSTAYLAGASLGIFPLIVRLFLDAWLFSRPITLREPRAGQ